MLPGGTPCAGNPRAPTPEIPIPLPYGGAGTASDFIEPPGEPAVQPKGINTATQLPGRISLPLREGLWRRDPIGLSSLLGGRGPAERF